MLAIPRLLTCSGAWLFPGSVRLHAQSSPYSRCPEHWSRRSVSWQNGSIPCLFHPGISSSLTSPSGAHQSPLQLSSRLDLPALERSVQCLLEEGLSEPSTRTPISKPYFGLPAALFVLASCVVVNFSLPTRSPMIPLKTCP